MKGLKLLIVDNDITFADHVVTILQKESVKITWIRGYNDTLAHVEYFLPDVAILNVNIPGINAMETLKQIKAKHPLVEVILAAKQNSIKTAIQGMRWGAVDYLKKPVSPDELVRKIKIAYQKKLRHQEKISRFEKILA